MASSLRDRWLRPPRLRRLRRPLRHRRPDHRVLVLAGMLAVIAMPLSVHDALHGGSRRFALTYVAVRAIVLLLNARAWRHALPARPLLNLYLAAFSFSTGL